MAFEAYSRRMELSWWSIEVLDGPTGSARGWREAIGSALVEAAITHGAYDWSWHTHPWGVLFEVAFSNDDRWETYRRLPVVSAALDAVPDPVHGLYVYPGRGGSAAQRQPRRPHPIAGAGAAPLPETEEPLLYAVEEGHPPSGVAWSAA